MVDEHRVERPLPVDPDLDVDRSVVEGRPADHTQARRDRRPRMVVLAATAMGGVLGALARYSLEETFPAAPGHIPWVVLAINVSGSALLGLVLVILIEQFPHTRLARAVIGTGIIGAYTTFSTFVVGAVTIGRDGHVTTAAIYVVLSVIGGLAAVAGGMAAGRLAVRTERWLQEQA
jgi:CrcB protein